MLKGCILKGFDGCMRISPESWLGVLKSCLNDIFLGLLLLEFAEYAVGRIIRVHRYHQGIVWNRLGT